MTTLGLPVSRASWPNIFSPLRTPQSVAECTATIQPP